LSSSYFDGDACTNDAWPNRVIGSPSLPFSDILII
jgi:hypothetical protein